MNTVAATIYMKTGTNLLCYNIKYNRSFMDKLKFVIIGYSVRGLTHFRTCCYWNIPVFQ